MANKIKRPKPFNHTKIVSRLKREQETISKTSHKLELDRIVSPLDTNIQFLVESSESGGNYKTVIKPDPTITSIRADGSSIQTALIFMFLDQGTEVRYAKMPPDFSNETSPNSLSTSHADYDRSKIFIDTDNPQPGLDARNFMKQVNELYKLTYLRRMKQALKSELN